MLDKLFKQKNGKRILIEELDVEEFAATVMGDNMVDSMELNIQMLAEKINEIIKLTNKTKK